MTEDPPRIVDDPSMPDALRADLRSVIDHPPAIELPESPPTPGPSLIGPILLGGVVALVLGGYAIHATRSAETPATESAEPAPAATPSAEPAAVEAQPVVVQPAEAEPAAVAAEPVAVEAEPAAEPSTEARKPARPAPTLADEIAHMAELRRIAGSDPRRALAMARAGERQFATGLFGEERQAILVLSLDRLGRVDAARAAARRFLRAHPASTFRARVEPIAGVSEGSRRSPHEGR